jgi:hypothetical protein
LAASISAIYDKRDAGWQNNPTTGADPRRIQDNKAARAKLHWYGTEGFDAVLTGMGGRRGKRRLQRRAL